VRWREERFVTTGATKPARGAQGILIASPPYDPRTVRPAETVGHSRARVSKLLRLLG
jgi:hypothetical protein